MTRFVGEPSTEGKAIGAGWGVRDLRRRPAPPAAAGLPVCQHSNPNLTLAPNVTRAATGLTSFYTTDPTVFEQDDGSGAGTDYVYILQAGVYLAMSHITKVTNNGIFQVYLHPSNTGQVLGGAISYNGDTTSSYVDTDTVAPITPYDSSILAFGEADVPVEFTVKYKWVNMVGSPTVANAGAVLFIAQLTPTELF